VFLKSNQTLTSDFAAPAILEQSNHPAETRANWLFKLRCNKQRNCRECNQVNFGHGGLSREGFKVTVGYTYSQVEGFDFVFLLLMKTGNQFYD
jgi:hypothetical protein